ncbi:hypothetical protein SAMD00019534_086420 [Acytostelium subglobosum LB1]|uniref:hypothetical protein n=1 Tax=Acytostelium subglobosum LB1 TaxID=1410327 RepID=UPI000644C400|nr:hypothetical protein SAMD00019534_086420 [Acytostelium subglobosum LB1]GAM25467.1 hypothetical protein SAMD00019534_086420 [Acytostelium subglobosum LB1]|eukprot:XP_012751453.1 hypothetical protein SAMD00019534_086420 [Acytostelium subglobosum LB1]
MTDMLPKSLTSLTVRRLPEHIDIYSLPRTLQTLNIGHITEDCKVSGTLPPSITSMKLNKTTYDQLCVARDLSDSLRSLTLLHEDRTEDPKVEVLPTSLTSLVFVPYCSITHQSPANLVLPSGLLELTYSEGFNYVIPVGYLPDTLTSLHFNDQFNMDIQPGSLPSSLRSLSFGYYYSKEFQPGVFPHGLQTLIFPREYDYPIPHLPQSLTTLSLGECPEWPFAPGALSPSITNFTYGSLCDTAIEYIREMHNLKTLTFESDFDYPLSPGSLPQSITKLSFGGPLDSTIEIGSFPSSLTSLSFEFLEQPIDPDVFPSSITHLSLCDLPSQQTGPITMPSGVKHLGLWNLGQCLKLNSESTFERLTIHGGDYISCLEAHGCSSDEPFTMIRIGQLHIKIARDDDPISASDAISYIVGQARNILNPIVFPNVHTFHIESRDSFNFQLRWVDAKWAIITMERDGAIRIWTFQLEYDEYYDDESE